MSWIPWIAIAALGIAVTVLSVENYVLNDQLRDESSLVSNLAAKASHAQQVLEVLTSPASQSVELASASSGPLPSARVLYLKDRGGLVFLANHLKPLPTGHNYDLWIMPADGGTPISAGIFQPNRAGSATVILPPLPTNTPAKAFAVTIEPEGGQKLPSQPYVLTGTAKSQASTAAPRH